MATRHNNRTPLNILLIVGTFCLAWNSGCTSKAARPGNQGTPPAQVPAANAKTSINGNWLCVDSRCEAGTVKIISLEGDSIQTTFTEHSAEEKQVCRIQETATLAHRDESSESGTIMGELTHGPIQVLNSPENTKGCAGYYQKINLSSARDIPDPVSIEYNTEKNQIKINGGAYNRMSDQELQALNSKQDEANMQMSSLAGNWVSVDPATSELHQIISSDLQELTTVSVVRVPQENQICHIQETSSLEIVDNTDPNKIYATQVREKMNLVSNSRNTEKCEEIVEEFNHHHLNVGMPQSITIQRDGNQELTIEGKAFTRAIAG